MLAARAASRDNQGMRGLGGRLKARTRELGLTDSEVARRLSMAQAKYSSYANDTHEPDLETLVRILRVLGMTADQALGLAAPAEADPEITMRQRGVMALASMGGVPLAGAVGMLEALVRYQFPPSVAEADGTGPFDINET